MLHARDSAPPRQSSRVSGVGRHELLDVAGDAQIESVERGGHDLGDIGKADPFLQEGFDGDLVRCVEDARRGAAALSRIAGERQQRECFEVGRVKLQGQGGQIELGH